MPIYIALALSVVAGLVAWYVTASVSIADELLRYVVLISCGAILVITGVSHVFRPQLMASELEWSPGGPFQTVVGIWNISVGVVAVASFWVGGGFLVATALVASGFWLGASLLHWGAVRVSPSRARIVTASGELLLVAVILYLLVVTR